MNIYSIGPFSGPKYRENEARLKTGETPCAICGKAVAKPWKFSATVVAGGADWARTEAEELDYSDAGYMGVWPIGPDCHRKYFARGA